MRWVAAAAARPHRCAFLPQLGSHHPRGYFDTGTSFLGEHVYVSVVAAEMMAAQLRMVPGADLRQARAQTAAARAEVERLRAELEEAEKFRESAQHAFGKLGGDGRIPARKPGRPKTKKQEGVAA